MSYRTGLMILFLILALAAVLTVGNPPEFAGEVFSVGPDVNLIVRQRAPGEPDCTLGESVADNTAMVVNNTTTGTEVYMVSAYDGDNSLLSADDAGRITYQLSNGFTIDFETDRFTNCVGGLVHYSPNQ